MTTPTLPDPLSAPLRGRLDEAGPTRIAGWAEDGPTPTRLTILDNGTPLATIDADRHRPDLEAVGIGTGRHGFVFTPPTPLDPEARHIIRVQRESDASTLPNSPWILEATTCRGHIDVATRTRLAGWALDESDPDGVATLLLLHNQATLARIVANAYRPDLAAAAIGRAWHGFELELPARLAPDEHHRLRLVRERDGAELPGSPIDIPPAAPFDPALEHAVAQAIAAIETPAHQARALRFLAEQADRLRARHADTQARRTERHTARTRRRQHGPTAETPDPPRRALVIDEQAPAPGRDAGSQAILSHIRALQRLGYEVTLVASEAMNHPAPEHPPGLLWCAAPFFASVEEVLRRQSDCFDVVYLHRANTAARYMALARATMPRARILYSVADLHHLRLERQAHIEQRPELLALARRMRLQECTAAWSADAVITHSWDELALLRRAVPEAEVHRVAWDIPRRPPPPAFARRRGLAFIGRYAHAPNADAAEWLVEAVMPLVWASNPDIPCHLVGADMPPRIRALAGRRVHIPGHVPDLGPAVFDRVRLTVAPLRYGAGIKGKILESLAAGIPCAMTPIAAEGLSQTQAFASVTAPDAPALAALILTLHDDPRANQAAAKTGQAILEHGFTEHSVTQALKSALEGRPPTVAPAS